ncbi:uncharacterized protein MONOS_10880 [Monocercomonoides exilis]|uniref:uncharacterized protein n=1 Tax=Monocercomonoides exilis TaxID=2049356 RepID=UPI003559636E|nr:hypothetical protein MONOS_10880 [Monocercomonoides exilis]|eukprot:MONOS_10880.1-p1 / transcript=MONOS_10880.1 / gene=MONOS_10880 / organism=Monocercomonoides_exilis_PA203 / gene_product=unspecified product / transcript_product=unspecified product / location=Mono_scaffold00514:37489-37899(-) / protein_length=137 / sequence_SO=supercontig / SO=protein_coding / is_pseudo=false
MTEDDKPSSSSSSPAIDPSYASVVAASYTSVAAMDDFERRLRIAVPKAAVVYANHRNSFLKEQQMLREYVEALRAVLCGGVVCAYDALSVRFSVTLVALFLWLATSVGTKSGSKRIFAAADVNAFDSINDLFDPSL